MKLLIKQYCINIDIKPDEPVCICIESPIIFRYVLYNLWKQVNGETGDIILSDDGKEVQIHKHAELIDYPFSVNCNGKKMLSKLYQEIDAIAKEEMFDHTTCLNSVIVNYIDKILEQLPYQVQYETELDVQALAKIYKVRFEDPDEDTVSRLISYTKLIHRVLGIDCFFFMGLKHLMTGDELRAFYNDLKYEHVYVMDLEGIYSYHLEEERCIIIDKDECRIDLV